MSEKTNDERARSYAQRYWKDAYHMSAHFWYCSYSSYLAGIKRGRVQAMKEHSQKRPPEDDR